MPTQTYWINRANQRMDQYILDSERVADEITKAYYKASKRIESQMIKTIQGLSALSDSRTAIKALIQDPDAKALKSLRRAVSALPEGKEKQEALTLLSSPAYQFRLRRLQATIDNARRECEKLYKVELKDTTRRLRQCYNSAFTHTIYDIDKGFNTLHTFSMFPASRVNTLLRSRWSGKNYSDRIWNSTNKLADTLKEQLLVSFMTGSGVTEAAAAIREEFQTSAHAARRLVRTETNFIANQSELDAYKRLGIEEYRYIATLDTRTSDICQSLDNQVIKIDDAKAGVNLPPMHPNCRSTTIMHDAEEPLKERIAKDENGKSIYVPGNMSYSQWLQKYHPELVDKLGGNGIIKSGAISGGLNPDGKEAFEHAKQYSESVRQMKTDYKKIAENTDFSEEDIKEIKEHVFLEKHYLGGSEPEYFWPVYSMAQSWQRLIDGKNIQPHDITLLNHEHMELNLMKQGKTQAEAHELTESVYNYSLESSEYYAKVNKHKK